MTGANAPLPGAVASVRRIARAGRALGIRFGTAESCTGGLIGARVTDLAGISDVYAGGVVSYANDVKRRLLGVPAETLARHGAVSAETARAMAEGVCRRLPCGASVAVTGVAGPGGGTPAKPVGTVWMAVHTPRGGTEARLVGRGADLTRRGIRERTMRSALAMLADALEREVEP